MYESGIVKGGWRPIIDRLMKKDPEWLTGNVEFLWAREYYDILFLKTILRKYAVFQHGMRADQIPSYQEKILKLFEAVPIFMSSQVINSKKDAPLYEDKWIQENAFQIPDKFML